MNNLTKEAVAILEKMTANQQKNAVKILYLLYQAWNDCQYVCILLMLYHFLVLVQLFNIR